MELKKITAAMRGDASPDPHDEREVSATWLRERMRKHADALDALAAQSQEPVAAVHGIQADYLRDGNEFVGVPGCYAQAGDLLLYAAPQPAPPQPAVPEEFARAQMRDGELWSWIRSVLSQGASIQQDYMHTGKYATYEHYSARLDCAAIERADELSARLYALAAAPAVKVPDGMRLVPQQFVSHVLALEHNWTKLIPTPPEFCCGPDSEHWFKEAYRRCGLDLSQAKAMLNASPEAGS